MEKSRSPSSQQHVPKIHEIPEDRLSSLPNNIIDVIVSYLPLKDAARTGILSHFWRYQWHNLSQLEFDKKFFPQLANESEKKYDRRLVKIVDQILIFHRGPIQRFRLSICLLACIDINRWILFLSRRGIREISLHKWVGEVYEIPSCLFLCKKITLLDLYRCNLVVPASFKRFSNLTKLELQFVGISNICLENLLSNCPLLSVLELIGVYGCTDLRLSAPNLVKLNVDECEFQDIWFVRTPILSEALINLCSDGEEGEENLSSDGEESEENLSSDGEESEENLSSDGEESEENKKLISILGFLPNMRRLCLLGDTYKILSAGGLPDLLPTTSQLLNLIISINLDDMLHMLITLWIFKSSSLLQNVEIRSISDDYVNEILSIDDFWGAQGDLSCLFSQLRTLHLTEFTGTAAELKFIETVLANAPVLDTVQIDLEKQVSDVTKISKKLNRFRRLSLAEVIIPD